VFGSEKDTRVGGRDVNRHVHWARVQSLFAECVNLSPEARIERLRGSYAEHRDVADEVERLLQQDDAAAREQFLEWPDGPTETATPEKIDDRLIGTQLGKFLLVERIGCGGSAVVYRAERVDGVRQEVAIKLLSAWRADERAHARFQAEVQALADLSHPNIARMLDSDTAPDGTPFLVMELVDGGPIDEYCESQAVPLRNKLDWFHTVCRAVAFAHGKGIVHRDLKPANVLITRDRRPVVTDFGLAKFLQQATSAEAPHTATGAILGTPGYMAPEQADGSSHHFDCTTDVYGLGAILYALLTGRPPHRGDSIASTLHKLKYEEPIPPRQLAPSVPLDVSTVCLKCLEKQPSRRYASAAALADDMQRYLAGVPIVARPLRWSQRSWRWIARNRILSTLFVVIFASFCTVTWLLFQAEWQRKVAVQKSHDARATVDTMYTEVSKWLEAHPQTDELRLRLLTAARDAYEGFSREQSHDPRILAETATAAYRLGRIEGQLGLGDNSKEHTREALRRFEELAKRFPEQDNFRFDLFHCHFALANFSEAFRIISELCERDPRPEFRDALAAAAGTVGVEKISLLDHLAAEPLFGLALDTAERLSAEFPETMSYRRHIGTGACGLAKVHLRKRQFLKAEEFAARALAIGRELWEASPSNIGWSSNYSEYFDVSIQVASSMKEWERARQLTESWDRVVRQVARDHPKNPTVWSHFSDCLEWQMLLALARQDDSSAKAISQEHDAALKELVRCDPANTGARLRLARSLADNPLPGLRDIGQATELLDSIPSSSWVVQDGVSLGIVQLRCGRPAQAIESLQRDQTTEQVIKRAYLALAYRMLGDEPAALAAMPTSDAWDAAASGLDVLRARLTSEFDALHHE
jgi:serine/threonine protein kinase/tetratricopeptide (TPR) repeat protein